jgi:hypothetical protein
MELTTRKIIAITYRKGAVVDRLQQCEKLLRYDEPSGFLQEFSQEPTTKHLHDIATSDWHRRATEFPPNTVETLTMWLYLRVTQICAHLRCFPPPNFPSENISDLMSVIAQLECRIEMSRNKVCEHVCHQITVVDKPGQLLGLCDVANFP